MKIKIQKNGSCGRVNRREVSAVASVTLTRAGAFSGKSTGRVVVCGRAAV